jgi:hypothetical protein
LTSTYSVSLNSLDKQNSVDEHSRKTMCVATF